MSTVTFSNGKTANFDGTPSPDDIDYVANQMGIQPDQPTQPNHGFFGNIVAGITKPVARLGLNLAAGYDAVTGNQQEANQLEQNGVNTGYYGNIKPVGTSGNFGQDLKDSVGTGLQLASNIIPGEEGAGLAEEGLKGVVPLLKSGAQAGATYGATSALGNSLVDNQNLGKTVLNTTLGGLGGAAVGAPLEAIGGKIAAPLLATAAQKASNLIDRTNAGRQIIEDTMQKLSDQYTGSQGLLHEMETKHGTDPIGVISSYGQKAMPQMENGRLNPNEAQDFIKQKIGELSNLKTDAVKANNTGVPIPVLNKNIKSTIADQNWSVMRKNAALNKIGGLMNNIQQNYPDGYIPLTELDTIKSEQTGLSKSYNNKTGQPFELDAHSIIGTAARNAVENATGDAPTQELNKLIQSHYDAFDLLDKFRGKTPRGGMLTKQLSRVGSELIGGAAGSMVGHPVLGALASRAITDKINDILGNDLISNPLKLQLVKNMQDIPNDVIKKMTDYLENNAEERASRLALPLPSEQGTVGNPYIMQPHYSGPSSVESITATKNPLSIDPKTGRYQTTYSSTPNSIIPQLK